MRSSAFSRRASDRLAHTIHTGTDSDPFGLRAALAAVRRHWLLALFVWAGCIAAALLYARLAPPVYRADTSLQIEARSKRTVLPSLPGSERTAADLERTAVSGELEVLGSRELQRSVIEKTGADIEMGMAWRHGFWPIGHQHGIEVSRLRLPAAAAGRSFSLVVEGANWELSNAEGLRVAGGPLGTAQAFKVDEQDAVIQVEAPADLPRTRVSVRQLDAASAHAEINRRMRMFEPARDANVVRISWEDRSPQRAAAFLNTLAEHYLQHTLKRKRDDSGKALATVEAELPVARARVLEAETAVASYQSAERVVPAPSQVEADALLRQRVDLQRQAVELRVKRDQLAQQLTPEHPDMVAMQQQLATVQAALVRLDASTNRLPTQQREVGRLQRELQSESQLYTALMTHEQQLRVMLASGVNDARQIDAAVVPSRPIRPDAASAVSLGIGAGLLLALAAVLLARAFNRAVTFAHEVPELGGVSWAPIVLPVSRAQRRLSRGRVVSGSRNDEAGTHQLLARVAPLDPAVEALRGLRLALAQSRGDEGTQITLVSSAGRGSGKAFVAANLAALLAEAGQRVLLVEADLRHPGIYRYAGIDPTAAGLADLLADRRSFADLVVPHATAGFDVLLHGAVTDHSDAQLHGPDLERLAEDWRKRYDHVVIHGAPVLTSSSALAMARISDLVLLVLRSEHTSQLDANMAVQRLQLADMRVDAFVLNRARRPVLGSAPSI